jgi:hypothetical protein
MACGPSTRAHRRPGRAEFFCDDAHLECLAACTPKSEGFRHVLRCCEATAPEPSAYRPSAASRAARWSGVRPRPIIQGQPCLLAAFNASSLRAELTCRSRCSRRAWWLSDPRRPSRPVASFRRRPSPTLRCVSRKPQRWGPSRSMKSRPHDSHLPGAQLRRRAVQIVVILLVGLVIAIGLQALRSEPDARACHPWDKACQSRKSPA